MGAGLRRGFESHGCLRMRESDLYSLHALVTEQGSPQMHLSLRTQDPQLDSFKHPFPKQQFSYQRVLTAERDEEGLIPLERVRGNPPILQLLEN